MIFESTPKNIALAAKAIIEGDLVAFPTETVYGLGADATNSSAISKIFRAKGRPETNPLIVHLEDFASIAQVANIPPGSLIAARLQKLKHLWPGPLSVVVPKSESIPFNVTAGRDTVAIRIPAHPIALALIRESGRPIAAPSANISEYISPTTAEHVESGLGSSVDFILDGGSPTVGLESTIISLVDQVPTLLRPGFVSLENLTDLLGEVRVSHRVFDSSPAPSPGLGVKHYSPHTKLILVDQLSAEHRGLKLGLVAFSKKSDIQTKMQFTRVCCLSEKNDLTEVAAKLYSALRDLDVSNLDLIVVERCSEEGIGLAIMDRLRRAAGLANV